jgi:hypothetical protein
MNKMRRRIAMQAQSNCISQPTVDALLPGSSDIPDISNVTWWVTLKID